MVVQVFYDMPFQFHCITIVQDVLTGLDRGHQDLSDSQVWAKAHKQIKSYG